MHLFDQILLDLVLQELFCAFFILEIAEVKPTLELLPVCKDCRQQEI